MADTVNLTIDDRPAVVPAGTLVIDAIRSLGIEVPVFCSHPKLDPVGVCRMCLVEFVGPRGNKLDTSCTVRASEGMVIRTDTPAVKEAREAVLGFLLINHPLDCPICDKGGECPLQDQTLQYGPASSQFVEVKQHKAKHYPISDLIMLDQERCVLCWRCIRYLEEWEDKPQLGLFKRGDRTVIDTFPGQEVDVKTSGNIIDLCPVGALTSRTARFAFRPWEITKTPSICTQCAVGCNLRLDERVHELRRIVARENAEVNDQWLCDKGRFMHQFVDHAERLEHPLVREDGLLRQATWAEALSRLVAGFGAVVEKSGPQAAGGIAGARVSNEAAYLFQKLFRGLVGSNNIDFPTGSAVKAVPTGLPSLSALNQHDLLVLVGLDPNESAPVLDMFLKRAAIRKGARMLVISPRKTELARLPGAFLPARSGTEATVLTGLAAAISKQKAAPRTAAPKGADEWGWSSAFTPELVTRVTGVPQAALTAATDLVAGAKNPLFLYGPQVAQGDAGATLVSALFNLAALLGAGDRVAYIPTEPNSQGCRDAGLLPDLLPGQAAVSDASARERLSRLWGAQLPTEAGLSYDAMLMGGVKALWVLANNPAASGPLPHFDFLVVQDLFLTETAQLADVVLPATSWAEADGTYTNLDRRIQRAPLGVQARGESCPDWQIIHRVASTWQAHQATLLSEIETADDWKQKRRKGKNAGVPASRPWNYPTAGHVLEELGKAAPIYANARWETLGTSGVQWPANALPRAARRIEPIAAPVPAAGEGAAFTLFSGPTLWDDSVLMQHADSLLKGKISEPFVALNPGDLAQAGLTEGITVQVTSDRGSVALSLHSDTRLAPGNAWIPAHLAGHPAEALGADRGQPCAVRITAATPAGRA
jgi:NADH-quinone oxidoreductase chain G